VSTLNQKVLFVATVDRGHILKFHIPYLKYFKEKGFEVHVACAGDADIPYCDKKYVLAFERSPYKLSNFSAYRNLKSIIDKNQYSLIHCHTPLGGVIGRLASRDARKKGTKVLYTAHGFHFYRGAALINWILYYPVEKLLSRYTDCLITINEEDYKNAVKNNFRANNIKLVDGIGVDLCKFSPQTIEAKKVLRNKYGYHENEFILIYAADLNNNKNQDLLIKAVNLLNNRIPNIKLLLAGDGQLANQYNEQVNNLGLANNVNFLGYRKDIQRLLKLSDIVVSASKREGLPVNVMEAMATGIPLVVTDCRGNRDLVINDENGYVVNIDDVEGFAEAIQLLYESKELKEKFSKQSLEMVKRYSLESVMAEMDHIYKGC